MVKCWKKVNSLLYDGKDKNNRSIIIQTNFQKGGKDVFLRTWKFSPRTEKGLKVIKNVKTYKESTKVANSYMRKHDKC